MIETLPPEDAAKLRSAIGALAQEEAKTNPKAAKPSPVMAAWLAGAASKQQQTQQPQTLDQVKKQGDQLQAAPPAPVPAPPAPGPQSSIAVDNLKKIIAQAEAIKSASKEKPAWSHEWDPKTNSIVAV
jgi:hypothetical protein